jgi:hypothetical protein
LGCLHFIQSGVQPSHSRSMATYTALVS